MHPTAILAALAFTAGILATPVPANVDSPISDAEWQALRDGGLKVRSAQSSVDQPISDAEWQALEDGGLSKREDAASLFKRDKVMNCGHLITGKGGSNGHGKWIPVQQFSDLADTFCKEIPLPVPPVLEDGHTGTNSSGNSADSKTRKNRQGIYRDGHLQGPRDIGHLSHHAHQPRQ